MLALYYIMLSRSRKDKLFVSNKITTDDACIHIILGR